MNRHAIRLGGIKHFHSLTHKEIIRKFRDQVERALNKPADRLAAVQVTDFLLKRFDLVGKVCEIEGDYHGVLIRDEVLKRFPPSDNVGSKHPAQLVWPILGSVPAPPSPGETEASPASPGETEASPEQSCLRKRKVQEKRAVQAGERPLEGMTRHRLSQCGTRVLWLPPSRGSGSGATA